MMIFCPFVFRVLTPDPAVRELAVRVLRIELLAEPLSLEDIMVFMERGEAL